MTKTQAVIASGAIALCAMFAYRPALFGFYGFSRAQCVFLFTPSAATATQAEIIYSECRAVHPVAPPAVTAGRDLLPELNDQTPAQAFGLGAKHPDSKRP
ncbi:hypothetical protein V5738_11045 [Salinisphaera sp. SPP-AMP-43]|uniref:hypothetical protein n=1 Tax=Salinisphaera sp. SPP-AMP-43 TaxID=3121288 RepID=UPI003C6E58FE